MRVAGFNALTTSSTRNQDKIIDIEMVFSKKEGIKLPNAQKLVKSLVKKET